MVLCRYLKIQCPFLNLRCEDCPRYDRYLITKKKEKEMSSKKQVVSTTYGTSWITSIVLAFIIGIIGAILGNASGNAFMGFLVGFVMVFATEFIMLACCIPFVGIYLYWIWSMWFYQWILNIAFAGNPALISNFLTLSFFPLILFAIFGAIIFVIFTVIALVGIVAIIGAILSH